MKAFARGPYTLSWPGWIEFIADPLSLTLFSTDKKTLPMMVDLYFPITLLHIMPLVVQILSWDTRHPVASNPLVVINTTTTIMMATMMRKMIWLIMQWTDIPIIHRRHPIHINNSNRITTEPKWFNENGIPDKKTDHLVAQRRIVLRVQKLRFFS